MTPPRPGDFALKIRDIEKTDGRSEDKLHAYERIWKELEATEKYAYVNYGWLTVPEIRQMRIHIAHVNSRLNSLRRAAERKREKNVIEYPESGMRARIS